MVRTCSWLLCSALLLTTACPVELVEPAGSSFACSGAEDCAPGYKCTAGRCLAQSADAAELLQDGSTADVVPGDRSAADLGLPDSSAVDASITDAAPVDASRLDAAPIDAVVADTAASDAAAADAGSADIGGSDSRVGDAGVSDGTGADAATPDAAAGDTSITDTGIADTSSPDTAPLDAAAPDSSGPPPWWDPNYAWRVRIDVDNSGLTSALTGVQVAVWLREPDALALGDDRYRLRFVGQGHAAALPHEVETWVVLDHALMWVRLPRIDPPPAEAFFWLYYGAAATADMEAPTEVWSGPHRAVWHLNALVDSSPSSADGTNMGSDPARGLTGAGRSFDGAGDKILIPDHREMRLGGAVTYELSFALAATFDSSSDTTALLLGKRQDDGSNMHVVLVGTDYTNNEGLPRGVLAAKIELPGMAGYVYSATSSWEADRWYNLTIVHTGGPVSENLIFIDGADNTGGHANHDRVADVDYPADWDIAGGVMDQHNLNGDTNPRYFGGGLDEIRIMSTQRSAEWVMIQERSKREALLTFGTPEPQP